MAKHQPAGLERTTDSDLFTTPIYARYMSGKERDQHIQEFEDALVQILGNNAPPRNSIGNWIDYVSDCVNYQSQIGSKLDYKYYVELTISEHSRVVLINQDIDLDIDGHYVDHGIFVNIYGTVYELPTTANIEEVVEVAFLLDAVHQRLHKVPFGRAILSEEFRDRKKLEQGLEDIKNGKYKSCEMPWLFGTASQQTTAVAIATKKGLMEHDIIPKETDKKHYTKDWDKFFRLLPELVEKYAPTHEQHLQSQQNGNEDCFTL